MLWAVFTIIAAAAQTARNAMQRELTATLGTVGATHVRFLFGFPFALFVFLPGVMVFAGYGLPHPPLEFWPWVIAGAFTQIAATATMLAVMDKRSFVVAYRLYQDRAGAGGAVRLDLPRRQDHAAVGYAQSSSRPSA